MQLIKSIFWFLVTISTSLLAFCWQGLLALIDIIDGGEETEEDEPMNNDTHYNYRTGNFDSVKRINGFYDDDQ